MTPLLALLIACQPEPEAPMVPPEEPVHSPVAYATAEARVLVDGQERPVRAWPTAAGERWILEALVDAQPTGHEAGRPYASAPTGPGETAELVVGVPPLAVARMAVFAGATPRVEVVPAATRTVDGPRAPVRLAAFPLRHPDGGWEIRVQAGDAPEPLELCGPAVVAPGGSTLVGVLLPGGEAPITGLEAKARPSRAPDLVWTEPPPCPPAVE